MNFDVENKVALVTGANRGIGLAITRALLDHGASKVYAAVRNLKSVEELKQQYGERIVPLEIDLERPATIQAAAEKATDVHLLVNNAGVLRMEQPLSHDAIDALKWEMEINVYGLLRMVQAFAPVLERNGGGALVQLNSVASLRGLVDISTYAASKAAAYSLTQSLRDQLQSQHTQVLSVHPGPIDTDMAAAAGLDDMDSPVVVAEGIVASLRSGEFHLFPDKMAKEMWEAYEDFAKAVVEDEATSTK